MKLGQRFGTCTRKGIRFERLRKSYRYHAIRTVRAALRGDEPRHYAHPKKPNSQLVPVADQIKRMLAEKRFIGTRILRDLRALGLSGQPICSVRLFALGQN